MPEIFLLTGEVHSGKTTAMLQWSQKRKDVYGILTPIVNGQRVFMNAHTSEIFPMEANENEEMLTVGKYRFSIKAFQKANAVISSALKKEGWIILDEVGPLELRGDGFYEVLGAMAVSPTDHQKFVVVVRQAIVEEVKACFPFLSSAQVITTGSHFFDS
jgi:nucleoside-triphosphatase THEP1